MYYFEIQQRREMKSKKPAFPSECPICKAPLVSNDPNQFYEPVLYACGGSYSFKPQIQNHTDKWWGKCGKENSKEVVN